MRRAHRKVFQINDELAELAQQERLVEQELGFHRLIDEDAQRDATTGNYIDREEAGLTAADVSRFERSLAKMRQRKAKLEQRRARLLGEH